MQARISYLSVLRVPGALRAFLPALAGRLALAMIGLALLLAVQKGTDSFATAGVATAAFGIANVVAAPWRARAADRWGQRSALNTLSLSHAVALCCLAFVTGADAVPTGAAIAVSAVIGLTAPPLGASMRVIWASVTSEGEQRAKAFSLDAVAEELLFVVGPVVISAIIVGTSSQVGLLVAAAAVVVGTLGMTTSPVSLSTRVRDRTAPGTTRPLGQPGFARVLTVLVGVGGILGVVEIAAPALATEQDVVAASGWLLGAFAAGSAAGGLLYGHIRWKASLGARLLGLCVGMGVATSVASRLGDIGAFAAGLFVVGLFLSPSMITGYLVADSIIPPANQTEASSWINTAINLGAALASAFAGVLIDKRGTAIALLLMGLIALTLSSAVPLTRLRHKPMPRAVGQNQP